MSSRVVAGVTIECVQGDIAAAFAAFAAIFPDTVLLVDTYDTLAGIRHVIELADELGDDFRVRGVRLDSGDLGALSRDARAMLDAAGLPGRRQRGFAATSAGRRGGSPARLRRESREECNVFDSRSTASRRRADRRRRAERLLSRRRLAD